MRIIRHRINSVADLRCIDPEHGAEFDIRSRESRLILNHEPHQAGESLRDFLAFHAETKRSGILVFNPKEDGLEFEILDLIRRYEIGDFFFLDLAMPTAVRMAVKEGLRDIALRVSEFEPAEAALRLKGKARWVWLDCFSGEPPAAELLRSLKEHFKICLVSPELEKFPKERIEDFRHLSLLADAVCTKFPELWTV